VSKLNDNNGTWVDDKNVTMTEKDLALLNATKLEEVDPKSQFGGGYLLASADSVDGAKSATRDYDKASNTAATLSTNSFINRYGYSGANDLANVQVSP
jgi:hypothetical protein